MNTLILGIVDYFLAISYGRQMLQTCPYYALCGPLSYLYCKVFYFGNKYQVIFLVKLDNNMNIGRGSDNILCIL